MECLDIDIPQNADIYFVGDLHLGEGLFARKQFDIFWEREIANNPRARVVGMGDWLSSIPPKDSRHDVRALDEELPTIEAAKWYLLGFLRKWKRKFLWFHTGNHEEKPALEYGDAIRYLCQEAGIPYGGFLAFVTLHAGGHKIQIISTHGDGSVDSRLDDKRARRRTMERRLVRLLYPLGDAQLYAMGHTHKLLVVPPEHGLYLKKGNGDVIHGYKAEGAEGAWFVNTGCWLRTYMKGKISYGEKRLYPPLELGCVKVTIRKGEIVNVEKVVR